MVYLERQPETDQIDFAMMSHVAMKEQQEQRAAGGGGAPNAD